MSRKKHHLKGGYSSSWIRPTTRLAVWLRDGLCCVYCCQDWSASGLTLDHIVARSEGGTNAPTNLVSACPRCNALKRSAGSLSAMASALGISASHLQARLQQQAKPISLHLRRRAREARKHPPAWLQELLRINTTWAPQRELYPPEGPVRPYIWVPDPDAPMPNEEPPF